MKQIYLIGIARINARRCNSCNPDRTKIVALKLNSLAVKWYSIKLLCKDYVILKQWNGKLVPKRI